MGLMLLINLAATSAIFRHISELVDGIPRYFCRRCAVFVVCSLDFMIEFFSLILVMTFACLHVPQWNVP